MAFKNKTICPECGKSAKCSYCKLKIREGELIICYREGIKHFCSDECMLAYFGKYSVETYAVRNDEG